MHFGGISPLQKIKKCACERTMYVDEPYIVNLVPEEKCYKKGVNIP
jgi:hypothetical protein